MLEIQSHIGTDTSTMYQPLEIQPDINLVPTIYRPVDNTACYQPDISAIYQPMKKIALFYKKHSGIYHLNAVNAFGKKEGCKCNNKMNSYDIKVDVKHVTDRLIKCSQSRSESQSSFCDKN